MRKGVLMFEFDMADVKPSVLNWVIVGLLAITFIVFAKYVVNTYDNALTRPFREVITSV